MINKSKKYFFAALNSNIGFKSYFSEIFNPDTLEKLYIIKGGPGTGKSRIMQEVGEACEEAGFDVEYFYCSTDPKSLDGIKIDALKTAVIDGTAPHMTDPVYPGAVDKIIYTGNCWDEKKLMSKREDIIKLIKQKNAFIKRAYHFISAAAEIRNDIINITLENLYYPKLAAAAKRLAQQEFSEGSGFSAQTRIISTVCARGKLTLDTFENLSKKVYIVEDVNSTAFIYLKELLNQAEIKKQKVYISYNPLNTEQINGLYFPDSSLCAIAGEKEVYDTKEHNHYKYINMERFISRETLRDNRQKLRFGRKCFNSLMDGVIFNLAEAEKLHKEIESIYISAMDFNKNNALLDSLKKSILN